MAFVTTVDRSSDKKVPLAAVLLFIVGIFVFLFGGLSPIFTGNIFHMFIFIGIAFLAFIAGGLVFYYKMPSKNHQAQNTKAQIREIKRKKYFNSQNNTDTQKSKEATVIYCPYCGQENGDQAEHCVNCNSKL